MPILYPLSALPQLRRDNGTQQDHAGDQLLIIGRNTQQSQSIADAAQQQHRHRRPNQRALAAMQRRTTHNDGSDGIHLHIQPGVGLRGIEPCRDDHPRQG